MDLASFFDERLEIANTLGDSGEISLLNTFNTDLPRIFIVAAASNFEVEVTNHIKEFYVEFSSHIAAREFVNRKALFRTYHQLFDWNSNNVNGFVKLFGAGCQENYKKLIDSYDWLQPAAKAFLTIGNARNELVHGDFATHSPTLIAEEVRGLYETGSRFVEAIPFILRQQDIRNL